MSVQIIRANALDLPIADNTVDLIVTSPPYFGLRSYQDGGDHYDGQIGDEATPAEFVDALIAATREMVRVLKPSGSIWVNLGDKYASGGRGTYDLDPGRREVAASRPKDDARPKSLLGIPWRYAIRCIDELGLILRAEVIWSKPNGLPESVTDRVRRSHETWFHFTLNPRYYSAVDEVREKQDTADRKGERRSYPPGSASSMGANGEHQSMTGPFAGLPLNPLGKLPGSVWTIATEPLRVPDHLGVDHFAAFPTEWPRRIITGWSPRGVCVECGEGLRPILDQSEARWDGRSAKYGPTVHDPNSNNHGTPGSTLRQTRDRSIVGYDCGCEKSAHVPELPQSGHMVGASGSQAVSVVSSIPSSMTENVAVPDTSSRDSFPHDGQATPSSEFTFMGRSWRIRPGVVLDPFGGTGTTALVADALGRHGISVDMSADYCRLAEWRTSDPKQRAKAAQKPYTPPAEQIDGQVSLLDLIEETA